MKKSIFLAAISILFAANLLAQQDTLRNKNGIAYLPERNDWAIGADVTPYINFIGNMFNNSQSNELDLSSQNLYFRYYITPKSAIRVNLSIGNKTTNEQYYVQDDFAVMDDPASKDKVEDALTTKTKDFGLLVGLQKSRGYGRLKGFYGLQLGYSRQKSHSDYTYGNEITGINQNPTNHWGFDGNRPLDIKEGKVTTMGFGGFVGVEYYILPKVCIGGEYNLMLSKSWAKVGSEKSEQWDGSYDVEKLTTPLASTEGGSSFMTERPATYGGLYLMFHF